MGVTVTPSFDQLRNKPNTVAGFGISDMATQTCGAVPFSGVTGKPTTMTGYGITDEKCKAWVNFNGTGTPAIRAAQNVSSITDYGVGNYGVNFTNAMQDNNYVASVTRETLGGVTYGFAGAYYGSNTAGQCRVGVADTAGNSSDVLGLYVSIFR